jgi:hypothetical protein
VTFILPFRVGSLSRYFKQAALVWSFRTLFGLSIVCIILESRFLYCDLCIYVRDLELFMFGGSVALFHASVYVNSWVTVGEILICFILNLCSRNVWVLATAWNNNGNRWKLFNAALRRMMKQTLMTIILFVCN